MKKEELSIKEIKAKVLDTLLDDTRIVSITKETTLTTKKGDKPMYRVLTVVKFNDTYYEQGDEVIVTKKDGATIRGSVITEFDPYASDDELRLDVSEKYHQNTLKVFYSDIMDIKRLQE